MTSIHYVICSASDAAVAITTTDLVSKSIAVETEVRITDFFSSIILFFFRVSAMLKL